MLEATLPPIILQYNTSVVFPLLHSIVLLTDSWQGDKSKCQWYWQDTTGYFLYWAPSQHLQFWPNRGRKYSILYMDQAKTFTKCVLSVYFEWRNWWTLSLSQLFKPFKEGKSTLECQSIKSCESKHSFCPVLLRYCCNVPWKGWSRSRSEVGEVKDLLSQSQVCKHFKTKHWHWLFSVSQHLFQCQNNRLVLSLWDINAPFWYFSSVLFSLNAKEFRPLPAW